MVVEHQEFVRAQELKMIKTPSTWPGETLCMKKRPRPGEPVGVMGYSEYGILISNRLPLIIYLRENFVVERKYNSIEAMLDDGWEID